MATPLEEISILDCSSLLPGPYCTMILAELGASVVKIERPGPGDAMRAMNPEGFRYMNGNKKLVTVDLNSEKGRALFLKLAAKSEVVIEGFRPGAAKRLGIDFDTVKEVNPSVVYCSISGYGQTGPYANLPGHDINCMGVTGLFSTCGDPESEKPEYLGGFQAADLSAAMFAVTSILAALLRPRESAPALFLDIAMTESLSMWMMPRFLEYLGQGKPSKSTLMGRGPYGVFETRDGKYLTLGVVEDHFWDNLCKVLALDDLASDQSLRGWVPRNRNRDKILPRLKKAIKERDFDFLIEKLTAANVPIAPVHSLESWPDDPQFKHRGFAPDITEKGVDRDGLKRFPVNCLTKMGDRKSEDPILGKDNDTILSGLGLGPDDIRLLREETII
ncbi:MAG: CaiB/BaiF CoA-transferase family protein [Chloroflexota bacterium]|nr:CaiB/BaiF CoA-transferase family protein [Chloroflexota bacterium]